MNLLYFSMSKACRHIMRIRIHRKTMKIRMMTRLTGLRSPFLFLGCPTAATPSEGSASL